MIKKATNILLLLPIFFTLCFGFLYSSFFSHSFVLQADELIEGTLQDVETIYVNDTTNLNNFTIKNETEFLFTNATQNKVVVWLSDQTTEFGSFGGGAHNFVSPTLITTLPNGSIYVYDSLRRLKLFNENYEFVDNFNLIQTPVTYLSMGRISSLTNDLKNNVYALDYENNMILKKNANGNEVVMLLDSTTLGLTITEHSQIAVSPNGEYIFLKNLNNGNNVYYLKNLTTLTQINLQDNNIVTASEIAIDCANNLFVLEKNDTLSLLHKFTRNTYEYDSYLYVSNNGLNNISNLKINVETGTIFALNNETNTLQTISPVNYNGIFSENIFSFVHPLDYTLQNAMTQSVIIASVKNNDTQLLQTPYNISPLHTLEIDEKVIVLSEQVLDNDDFTYVLYVNATTKENVSGYILKTNLELLQPNQVEANSVRILNNNTQIYKYPTTLTTNEQAIILGTLNKNEEFSVLNTANEMIDANKFSFYAVLLPNNTVGYIRTIDAVSTNVIVITPTLFTNAEIIITDGSSSIIVYSNPETLETTTYTLQKNKRIYIESYNAENTYTEIKFLNDEQQEITGFIQTKYIKVHGDYNNLLQALVLSSVSFVLIFVLFIIKTRKKVDE